VTLLFNGVECEAVEFDSVDLDDVYMNGDLIFHKPVCAGSVAATETSQMSYAAQYLRLMFDMVEGRPAMKSESKNDEGTGGGEWKKLLTSNCEYETGDTRGPWYGVTIEAGNEIYAVAANLQAAVPVIYDPATGFFSGESTQYDTKYGWRMFLNTLDGQIRVRMEHPTYGNYNGNWIGPITV